MSIASDFIKKHEGCRLQSYQDQGGVWTIGYGSTGPDIVGGMIWTQEQANERFEADISSFERDVLKLIKRPLSEQSKAALTSFAYNLGTSALAKSTLLQLVNDKEDLAAAKAFLSWDHVGHDEVKGLLIRRLEEATLYLKGL